MKTVVFLATLNEAGNVVALLDEIIRFLPEADILVIDDGSTDGTVELMRQRTLPQLSIIERPKRLGLGSAHLLAFCHAIQHGHDVLVTMDADGSHEPSSIPRLLDELVAGQQDLVIGSRYCPGGRCDYTGYRRWISAWGNAVARRVLGMRPHELTTSFRAFRIDSLRQLDPAALYDSGYTFFISTVFTFAQRGMRVSEVPIHFRERGLGQSKIPSLEILRAIKNLIRLAARRLGAERRSGQPHAQCAPCPACDTSYSRLLPAPPSAGGSVDGLCLYCGDGA